MTILYLLLPLSLLFVLAIGVSLWWAVFNGQYDDTDSAGTAILRDDDSGPGSRGPPPPICLIRSEAAASDPLPARRVPHFSNRDLIHINAGLPRPPSLKPGTVCFF